MCGPVVKMCGPDRWSASDHGAQLVELFVPLPRIAERGHPVAQLTQRKPGIVFDMEVEIDQARDDRLP